MSCIEQPLRIHHATNAPNATSPAKSICQDGGSEHVPLAKSRKRDAPLWSPTQGAVQHWWPQRGAAVDLVRPKLQRLIIADDPKRPHCLKSRQPLWLARHRSLDRHLAGRDLLLRRTKCLCRQNNLKNVSLHVPNISG